MKRVVVTGMGIVSSIGNNKQETLLSLQNAKSGITFAEEYARLGFRSQVHGNIKNLDYKEIIDKKISRFMGQAAGYGYIAMQEAIDDAKLSVDIISNYQTGLIVGSGGGSNADIVESADLLRSGGIKKLGPYRVTRSMGNTTSACLATAFKVKGTAYSISSACATSAHCIGAALEQIQMGKQKVMFAGGAEELDWSVSMLFDAMGALSSHYNSTPELASRAFDTERDGFVIAGGAGIIVLEDLEHALNRNAPIYAELIGYGNSSDGHNMVQPAEEGAIRCIQNALATVSDQIDYVNAHGTSTPVGDLNELNALKKVFTQYKPAISSTKSLTGHSLGAAGVQEAIYSILMLNNNFITPSVNIQNLVPEAEGLNIIREKNNQTITTVLSNSFGFGGVNASLVFKRY